MYIILLPIRYLTSKIMPLLAAFCVLLASALLLIVWSVMGGFLDMLIGSGRTMTGDVVIAWPNAGFPHYQDLITRLEKDELVEAASPVIESFGMVGLPSGRPEGVMFRGIDPKSYSRVTSFRDILWWRSLSEPLRKDKEGSDVRLKPIGGVKWDEVFANGLSMSRVNTVTGEVEPALVLGSGVSGLNYTSPEGTLIPQQPARRTKTGGTEYIDTFLPRDGTVTINMLPLSDSGRPSDTATRVMPVANEFFSGQFELDSRVVLMPLDVAQKMLKLDESPKVVDDPSHPDGYRIEGTNPARTTHIYIRGKGDLSKLGSTQPLAKRVEEIYDEFAADHPGEVPTGGTIYIRTWEQLNGQMIAAVQTETALVLFLFSIMSFASTILVLSIFWAMISEKTKDIGILRALGASKAGVAWVWLSYGLVIGIVGAAMGIVTAYVIVWNINVIHEWIGEAMGIKIWDPSIYYFTNIPNKVETSHAIVVGIGCVMLCFLGAVIPALRAAWMHPVRALRFE